MVGCGNPGDRENAMHQMRTGTPQPTTLLVAHDILTMSPKHRGRSFSVTFGVGGVEPFEADFSDGVEMLETLVNLTGRFRRSHLWCSREK